MKRFLLYLALLAGGTAVFAQAPKVEASDLDYRKDGNGYLLVLKRGQPVIASLMAFLEKEHLPGASLSGIGAVKNAEVAYYDIGAKKYNRKKFEQSIEVLSITGNLGHFEGKPIVHAHMVLGGPDFSAYGGHLFEAEVSLILEIFITPTSKAINREWNEELPELRTMKPVRD